MSSSEYSDSDNENHSDADIQANGGSENSGQIRRKGRGYDKPKWGKSGKEKIEFTKDGLCIVPKDAKLSRYLGSLARNYSFLPLSHTDWRSHNDPAMEKMWKTISDTIDWRPEDIPYIPTIRHALLKRLSKRVRNNKAALKEKYYTPHVGTPLRFICGDNRVDSDQWQEMVNYWDNDHKNKNKVEKNAENRKKLKTSHTGGTKTFVRHQAEFEQKQGHAPDPIETFDLVHKRKDKHKSWIDDASQQIRAMISQELAQLIAIHGEETPELRLQAYVKVMGFETGGRVRGYGDLVTPSMVPWVQQTQPTSSIRRSRRGRDYASLESKFLDLQEKYESQQAVNEQQGKEIEELRHMFLSSQQQSSNSQLQHSQQHSPSQHTPSSHQYPPYPQPGPYRYPSSSQFYYPQPYRPPLYPPMPYPHGEFTGMLTDPDFMHQFMPPDQRNSERDHI